MAVTQEEWRPVRGREKEYEVSSFGRVRSLRRHRAGRGGKPVLVRERILRTALMGSGYPSVSLGRAVRRYVHRLVAEAFSPNPLGLPEVNHIDGDKLNASADNLEWVSHRENGLHASRHGLLATGAKHGRHTKPEAFNGG